jgi:hypothetical protein
MAENQYLLTSITFAEKEFLTSSIKFKGFRNILNGHTPIADRDHENPHVHVTPNNGITIDT